MSLVLLGVVGMQDLQCQLYTLQALLHLRLARLVLILLIRSKLRQLRLGRGEVSQGLLERGDLLLELSRARAHGVDLGAELAVLSLLVRPLLHGLAQLLVAVGLVRSIGLGVLRKGLDHVPNQPFHLREGIVARGGPVARGRGHAPGQLRQRLRMLLPRQVPDEADGLEVGKVSSRPQSRLLRALLEQGGCLAEAVRNVARAASHVGNGLLRLRKCLQLLATALRRRFVVLGPQHAALLEASHDLFILRQGLLGLSQVALRRCFCLGLCGETLLRLIKSLSGELDLVLQRLLQHPEVVRRSGLLLPRIRKLVLGLLQDVLQRLHNGAAVARVHSGVRSTKAIALIVGSLRTLHQSAQSCRALGSQHGGLHHETDRFRHATGLPELHHCRSIAR
mmetsp:Transcript_93163/g.199824  ORF Transcript_93163/g.199824 Transcript_93163/m.199824 type:complete len:393 (+) Transcript_93163:513-1691(+)